MKIVVISDTHGDEEALRMVAMREYDADLYLHAGDVGLMGEGATTPFAAVKGNCDFYSYPRDYHTQTPYGPLYMRHYPLDSDGAYEAFAKKGWRIFIHGHTHTKECEKIGDLWVFCPGSISYPRDGDKGSYLVIKIEPGQIIPIFKTL